MKLDSIIYNERDELGQKLLSFNGTTPGQTIDYQYNIRKWLTQINDPDACNTNLFGMRLGYTTANASLNATAKYNGNIAWIEWRAGAYCVPGGCQVQVRIWFYVRSPASIPAEWESIGMMGSIV
ncbi:MAG: hypothetical protein IPP42_20575 [Saprospiraceae bacterium]|nr:hypothetical protein [Saprospiraceae bacterium]